MTPQKHGRIDVADILRALAIMAIIVLHNIEHMNFYSFPDRSATHPFWLFTDRAIWDGLFFTFGGKAYAVFAMLFGFSFFIMYDNQRMRGNDFRLRFVWRMVLLFLFGLANCCFFWGDILVMYAVLGLILPLTCRMSSRAVLALAIVLLMQPLQLAYTLMAAVDPSFVTPSFNVSDCYAALGNAEAHGTFWDVMRTNLTSGQIADKVWSWQHGRTFQTPALFLLGMLIGRHGLFKAENNHFWSRVLCFATLSFFPLYGIGNLLGDFITNKNILEPLSITINSWSNFAFMLMLVSGVILVFYRTKLQSQLMKLAPYGKTALTNYLSQSVIGAVLYYNWGFGLHDDMSITASALIGVGVVAVQFFWCTWWMKHHSHGPLEGLWKKATWIF